MGLDMYLTKKIFIGANYEFRKITGKIELFKDGEPIPVDFSKVSYISENVAYWQKANAIHNWFVANVQEGEDDCGNYYVSEENLQSLLDDVNSVLEDHSLAEEVLPTIEGFFFGGIEYDERYFNNLKYTKEVIEKILKEDSDWFEYEYHSYW